MMLGITATRTGGWTLLRVSGELDLATAPALRQALAAQITEARPNLAVDLGDVDFADSTGLGVLLGGLVRARRHGGDLRVTALSPRLSELFDLVGLERVLAVVEVDRLPALDVEPA